MPDRAIEDRRHLDTVVDLVVGPRLRSLEGFSVNRAWPTPRRRLIGPFIFFDHLQPVDLGAGEGFDVPPHPHIGLATVTWLFEGELLHADSLGVRQLIRPGELNWMTAGRGITHSERTPAEARARDSRLHGTQAWVALPKVAEDEAPRFEHVDAEKLPAIETSGARITVIAGELFGEASPVETSSQLFYAEIRLGAGSRLEIASDIGERGLYVVAGSIGIDAYDYEAGKMLALASDGNCLIQARAASTLMLLGGDPLRGEREIWWNFVASDAGKIEQARQNWAAGNFPVVPGDEELMPLPG
jgi:redox-sensitive bicupin YhaK (pirin superfamily)